MDDALSANILEGSHDPSTPPTPSTPITPVNESGEETQEDGTESDVVKLRSSVWHNFTRMKINGSWKAQCNFCKGMLGGETKNGTNHLHGHHRRCGMKKGGAGGDLRQTILTGNFIMGKEEMKVGIFDQATSRIDLAKMIIMHEYPLSIVEHRGFRNYSRGLQPQFKVPSRNTTKSDIFKIYEFERRKIMQLLERTESRIAITTDMWTSNQNKGFMAITGHFVDNAWTLQSRIIRFVYVPCPHTSDVLSETLMECLLDWNIDVKLSTVTLDNCSTNDAMVDLLLDQLQPSNLINSGKLFHMRCCAHILNLIVKDGLMDIKDAIERIRDSVSFWCATPKREEKFEDAARQVHVPYTKKLVLDCRTRWNSTYEMLEVAIAYKNVFTRAKQKESRYKTLPTENEWTSAKEVCGRLKVFFKVTKVFSGTKYPTANIYFPQICEVKLSLNEWLKSPIEVVSNMASSMLCKFEKYWDVIHGIMGVAAVLDPTYKMALLEYYFPKIYGSDASSEVASVRQLCYDLVSEYEGRRSSSGEVDDHLSVQLDASQITDGLSGYDLFVRRQKRQKTTHTRTELDNYLDEEILPRSPDFDILLWWKQNGVKYPMLQAIARDVLAIPVSTVASESAFSTSGRLISPNRNRLHPETIEALMCSQNWLLATEKKCESTASEIGLATIFEDMDVDGHSDITEE